MKKSILTAALMCVIALSGCGSNGNASASASSASTSVEQTEEVKAPDLSGDWKQVNSDSETSYHAATIKDDTIEIYWVNEDDETKALYWAGTYVAPETADEPYTWDSENDKEKTDSSILASGDDTKTFTYQDGQISYEASALGVTKTVRLEKE